MSMETKSHLVTGEQINKVLHDPDYCTQVTHEFVRDFKTMMESLANLYEQNVIVFTIGKLRVKAEVTLGDMTLARMDLFADKPRDITEKDKDKDKDKAIDVSGTWVKEDESETRKD